MKVTSVKYTPLFILLLLALLVAFGGFALNADAKSIEEIRKKHSELRESVRSSVSVHTNVAQNSESSKKSLKKNSTVAEAQSNSNDDDNDNGSAFGHFIAPGWIKKHGLLDMPGDFGSFPPGIQKLIKRLFGDDVNGGNGGGNGGDTTAPVISGATIDPATTTALFTWNTNENSNTTVYVSTTSPVTPGAPGTLVFTNGSLVTVHSIHAVGLTPSTTYYALLKSMDAAGNTATSSQISFVTDPSGGTSTPDTTPPVLSAISIDPATTTAVITWNTNELANTKAYLSTTSPVSLTGTSTLVFANAALTLPHVLNVNGLVASTTYYVILQSSDANGNTATSSQQSFTTDPIVVADTTAPVITNVLADATSTAVTFTWNTNEAADGTVWVSLFTPIVPGASTTKATTTAVLSTSHSLTVSDLLASTTYHGRVGSMDASGNIATSTEVTFTTDADIYGPTITSLNITPGTTTASVTWNTNEPATSKAYFSTTTGFTIGGPGVSSVATSTLTLAHTLLLSGLSASTTYYVIVESIDAAANITRTLQSLFVTGA